MRQSGCIANRHISNNIRLVLDILDYADVILRFICPSRLLQSLCFSWAQIYIFSLKKFGFSDAFCNAVKAQRISSIRIKNGTTSRFHPNRGVHQGVRSVLIFSYSVLKFLPLTSLRHVRTFTGTWTENSGWQMSADTDPTSTFKPLNTNTTLYVRPIRKCNSESHRQHGYSVSVFISLLVTDPNVPSGAP